MKHILTLRYAPNQNTIISKLVAEDFQVEKPNSNLTNFIEDSIKETIKREIGQGEKISISLSSGVDSTLVLAILRQVYPDNEIESISVKFSDSIDETVSAKKISEKFETNHNLVYVDNFLEELPKMISIVKLPFWDLHWYHIAKKAKSLSTIFLSGDGGDELFGGYTFRYKKFLETTDKNSSKVEKVKAYLKCHERDWVEDQELIFDKSLKFNWNDMHQILEGYFDNSLPMLSQVMLADFNGKLLYNMLPLYSKFHNYFEIKNITPILNQKLIRFACKLPNELKYDSSTNTGKLLLLQLLEKYKIGNLVSKKKQGFSVDTKNLWNSYGQRICKYYLDDARTSKAGIINQEWIKKYINQEELDVRIINKFLGLLALEIWYRLFISKEIDSSEKL